MAQATVASCASSFLEGSRVADYLEVWERERKLSFSHSQTVSTVRFFSAFFHLPRVWADSLSLQSCPFLGGRFAWRCWGRWFCGWLPLLLFHCFCGRFRLLLHLHCNRRADKEHLWIFNYHHIFTWKCENFIQSNSNSKGNIPKAQKNKR